MLVVIPYHGKDLQRAIDLLCWMRELDGKQKLHRALLVGDYGMATEEHDRVKAAAYDAFGTAFDCTMQNAELRGWPFGPNAMFQTACAYNRKHIKEDFFWCEPDCIPLKKGWLDLLQAEYKQAGMPFMGYLHNKPWLHITGCAVYPWNLYEINAQILMANATPWDCVTPEVTRSQAHVTRLIQHVWSFKGDKLDSPPATFPDRASLAQINEGAVVFHRNKDGTLIERLSGKASNAAIYLPGDVCVVQLGRYGDLLNILPVVKYIHDHYRKPTVMVARQFQELFDAVPYAHRYVFEGDFSEVERAVELARVKFELVVCTQVWGRTWRVDRTWGQGKGGKGDGETGRQSEWEGRQSASYNQESWRMAGFGNRWTDPELKLVLEVPGTITLQTRPTICVCLSSGHSSPFKEWPGVQEHLQRQYGGAYDIVDLAEMRCDRVYDLLKWIRNARLLITSDTATLHLAAACATPVVALVNDDAWLASEPRCRCVLRLPYRDALGRIEEIDRAIDRHAGIAGGLRRAAAGLMMV